MPGWPVWASCVSVLSAGLILTEPCYRWRVASSVCGHWGGFVSGSKYVENPTLIDRKFMEIVWDEEIPF